MSRSDAIKPLSIKQNFFWNSFGSIVYQGCLWLTTVLVVVLSHDYENSGILAYAMAIGNLFYPLALYGTRTIQVSDLKNKYSQQNYIAFRVITILMSLVIFVIYILMTTMHSPTTIAVCVAFLLFKADESFSIVCFASEQKCDRMDYIGKSLLIRGVACLLAFVVGLLLTSSLFVAVLSMFVLCASVTLVYDLPHARLFGSIKPEITKEKTLKLLRDCLPAVASVILCNAVISVSRQIFSLTYGDDALGIYAAVATPAVLVQTLATFLYNPLLTTVAKKWHQESVGDFCKFLSKTFLQILLVLAVSIVALSFIGRPLLVFVYGASIEGYVHLFPAVLVISGLVAIVWFMSDVLIVIRDYKSVLWLNVVSFVLSLALIKVLSDAFYMDGINLTIIISYVAGILVGAALLMMRIRQRQASDINSAEKQETEVNCKAAAEYITESDYKTELAHEDEMGCVVNLKYKVDQERKGESKHGLDLECAATSSVAECRNEREPVVSIVVPVYNTSTFLCRCLDSLLRQTFRDIEIVIVNDGSTDESPEIIAEYAAKDNRIKVVNQQNQGLGEARNSGIRAARGEFLTCVDSDDVADPRMVELLHNALVENSADISICQAERILYRDDGSKKSLGVLKLPESAGCVTGINALQMQLDMVSLVMGTAWCKMVRRSLHTDKDIWYPGEYRFSEDGVVCVDLYINANRVAIVNETLYEYVQTGKSLTSSYSVRKAEDLLLDITEIEKAIEKANLSVFTNNFLLANLFSAGKQVEWSKAENSEKEFIKARIKKKSEMLHPDFSRKEMPLMYRLEAKIAHSGYTPICCRFIHAFRWVPAIKRML